MDKQIEERFVKKFIAKDKRSRTFYELCSDKKRDQIIHRIIGNVDKRYEIFNEAKINDDEFLKQVAKVFNVNYDCYVIADSDDDGKILPFNTAFKRMMYDCADYILLCGEDVVVMKQEVIFSPSSKIILSRK